MLAVVVIRDGARGAERIAMLLMVVAAGLLAGSGAFSTSGGGVVMVWSHNGAEGDPNGKKKQE